jgi:hypothetical protein
MDMFHSRAAGRLAGLTCAVLALLAFSSVSPASDVRYLWQSRDQFVALERLELAAAVNDHPTEQTLERLSSILSSIVMRGPDGAKPEPVFTQQGVEILAPHLQQALRQASSGEDVTFAVIGLHSALFGFAKSPKVTTGRVFYKAGRLNVVFGCAQKDFNEREDRRISPFIPGSRQKAAEGEWTLLPQTGRNGFSLVRKDWVTFSDEWLAPVAPAPVVEQKAPPVPAAPVQPVKTAIDPRKPSERLTILNELKDKGLITEEEYRGKRLEILNGL